MDDKERCQRRRWLSGCCKCQIEHCSLMALEREEVCAFVFRPLNGAEAYLSCFEGDCKDTNGYFVGEKGIGEFRYRVQDL